MSGWLAKQLKYWLFSELTKAHTFTTITRALEKRQQRKKTMTELLTFVIIGAFVLQGLKKITASPPHKGQATFLGKKIEKVYNEGWGFFPFFPFLVGFIPIKVARITFLVVSEKTLTPDGAESRVPVTLTIRPLPEKLIAYIDSGEEEGVKEQLTGKIIERLREWVMDNEAGPATWLELNHSNLEAASVLVKQIAGELLPLVPDYAQTVPTWIWMRYFTTPRGTKFLTNEEPWVKNNWATVKAVVDSLSPEQMANLKEVVKERRQIVQSLRNGTGHIIIADLGIVIERLNIGDIDVLGEVGKEAADLAVEERQKLKEELELQHFIDRVNNLREAKPEGAELTLEQAIEQTRLALKQMAPITRTIDTKHFSVGVDPATIAAIVAAIQKKP